MLCRLTTRSRTLPFLMLSVALLLLAAGQDGLRAGYSFSCSNGAVTAGRGPRARRWSAGPGRDQHTSDPHARAEAALGQLRGSRAAPLHAADRHPGTAEPARVPCNRGGPLLGSLAWVAASLRSPPRPSSIDAHAAKRRPAADCEPPAYKGTKALRGRARRTGCLAARMTHSHCVRVAAAQAPPASPQGSWVQIPSGPPTLAPGAPPAQPRHCNL